MSWPERLAVAPLLAGIIFIGVYPQPLLTRIQPAVDHLVAHMEYADPSLRLPSTEVGHGTLRSRPTRWSICLQAEPSPR